MTPCLTEPGTTWPSRTLPPTASLRTYPSPQHEAPFLNMMLGRCARERTRALRTRCQLVTVDLPPSSGPFACAGAGSTEMGLLLVDVHSATSGLVDRDACCWVQHPRAATQCAAGSWWDPPGPVCYSWTPLQCSAGTLLPSPCTPAPRRQATSPASPVHAAVAPSLPALLTLHS